MPDAVLHTLGLILFILVMVVGLALHLLGLPGNWVILANSALYALITKGEHFGWQVILVLLILAVVGEVADFLSSAVGARKFGASRGGMIAALIGGLAGAIIGSVAMPVVGTLLGAFLGTFIGAFGYELRAQKELEGSLVAGFGALLGRVGAIGVKMLLGIVMVTIVLLRVF